LRIAGLVLSGALALVAIGPWLRDMRRSGFERANYRGARVAFPAGAVLIAVSLIALAPLAVLDDRADLDLLDPDLRRWAIYAIGLALLGLLDDSLGSGSEPDSPRGWRGHARALAAGRFSTGFVKAAGALALAAFATSGRGLQDWRYAVDLLLLLLSTNLFNLLDLRPGRAEKGLALLLAGLCIGAWTASPLDLMGVFIGPVAVGTLFTLRERAMLGDTGSNLVGAIAGISLLTVLGADGRLIALGVVAALTVFGEFRSISAAIDRIMPLRALDSIGRLR
jgi:UDP-GlcNAc:undecaprenyl-phosphate/decaprenyl-phosphate GlcNAc-1-phosphate transferase